jgi:LmbE family N-acetylglucosaminyl deacetylase
MTVLIIMKTIKQITIVFLIITVLACSKKPTIEELQSFKATETYPDDLFLDTVTNKKALVIIAHDDDDCLMSGTISKLTKSGWEIRQLSLVRTRLKEGQKKHPSEIICAGNTLILDDGDFRFGLDTIQFPYVPISKKRMDQEFKKKKVTKELLSKINNFNPSVIFTMDNEMGGYGNPDHVFISQLVLDLFKTEQIFIDRIYQGVYTDHMEKEIIDNWLYNRMKKYDFPNPYSIGKKIYNISGMPEPNIQINIKDQASTKMNYLLAYHNDARKNMGKFIPYFEEFDAETYFSVFNYEYYRIIEHMSDL